MPRRDIRRLRARLWARARRARRRPFADDHDALDDLIDLRNPARAAASRDAPAAELWR